MTALLHAAKQGNTALGKVLVDGKADLNIKNKEQLTALLYATKQGNTELSKILVEGKADLNVTDQQHVTALQYVAKQGNTVLGKFLLDGKADLNVTDQTGRSALYWYCAAEDGRVDMVNLLLRHQPDWRIPHQDGSTAEAIAFNKGHLGIFEILKSHRLDQVDGKSSKASRIAAAKQESEKMLASPDVQKRLGALRSQVTASNYNT
eukprot:g3293.t1